MANNGGEPLVKLNPEGTAPILSYNVAQLSALSAIFDHRGDIQRDFVETRDIDGEQYQL